MIRNKGFTLIEAMIIATIIATLAIVAIPMLTAVKINKEKQKTEQVIEKKKKEDSEETVKDI